MNTSELESMVDDATAAQPDAWAKLPRRRARAIECSHPMMLARVLG